MAWTKYIKFGIQFSHVTRIQEPVQLTIHVLPLPNFKIWIRRMEKLINVRISRIMAGIEE